MAPTPDLLSPAFYADIDGMHDAFRTIRADGPVWRDEANELWAVRAATTPLIDAERRADVFSSSGCYRSGADAAGKRGHDRQGRSCAPRAQRPLVARQFTPKAVQRSRRSWLGVIDELIDGFVDRGEIEVVDDLAAPFPPPDRSTSSASDEHGRPCARGRSG